MAMVVVHGIRFCLSLQGAQRRGSLASGRFRSRQGRIWIASPTARNDDRNRLTLLCPWMRGSVVFQKACCIDFCVDLGGP